MQLIISGEDGDLLNVNTGYRDLPVKDLDIGDDFADDEDEELVKNPGH